MATLTLTKLWLNLLSSGQAISAYGQIGRTSQFNVDGEVRTFAGGRQRSVTIEGEQSSYSFVLQDVSLAVRDVLRAWFGQNVIVRDHRGQAFQGVFYAVDVAERTYEVDLYEIAITLRSTTTPEGV